MIWHTEKPIPDKKCIIVVNGDYDIAVYKKDIFKDGWFNKHNDWYIAADVMAWSPLPEPYRDERRH